MHDGIISQFLNQAITEQEEAREAGPEGGVVAGIWPAARWMLGTVVPCRKVFLSRAREEPDWLPEAAGAASPGRTSATAEGGAARGCSEWASRVLGP